MKIEVNMNEINSVEKIISKVLFENDFNKLNGMINQEETGLNTKFLFPNINGGENAGFVSIQRSRTKPFVKLITEEEFFKIVGATKKGLSSRSGRFQEHLYSCYMEAIKKHDEGYITDIINKAIEFQTNLNYVKRLMKNKSFASEWRKDFGDETAVNVFKRKGNMKIINMVKERTN